MIAAAWEEEEDDDDDDDDVDDVFYNRLRCLVLEYVNEGDTGKHGKTIPIRISTSSNNPIPSQSTARLKIYKNLIL